MTAGQLVKHEAYLNAVRGLKEGHITEQAFLAMFSHKQRQGLFKLMESHRSASMTAKWKALKGEGSKGKKQSMLLAFIKGGLQKSLVNLEQTVQQGWESTKTTAWVSWKKMTDEFGEEEAVQRLKAGLIRMRKDAEAWNKGLRLYQFLKVEEEMKMGRSGNQAMTGCSTSTTTEAQAEKVARALKGVQGADEEFFNAAWLGKKPKDVSIEGWQETESEELDAASQHESEADMELFLAGLGVAGPSAPAKACDKASKASKACDNAQKLSEPNSKEPSNQTPEACEKAKKNQQKLQKFDQNVDQLSSCNMSNAKRNTRKMVSLLAAEIKTATGVAKKQSEHKGLKQSLQKLQKVHEEVEQAMVDEKKEKALITLLQKAAKILKGHKRILQAAEA